MVLDFQVKWLIWMVNYVGLIYIYVFHGSHKTEVKSIDWCGFFWGWHILAHDYFPYDSHCSLLQVVFGVGFWCITTFLTGYLEHYRARLINAPRKSKSTQVDHTLPSCRFGSPCDPWMHPKVQPLCLVDWTCSCVVCNVFTKGNMYSSSNSWYGTLTKNMGMLWDVHVPAILQCWTVPLVPVNRGKSIGIRLDDC